jgi:hypothetical protein
LGYCPNNYLDESCFSLSDNAAANGEEGIEVYDFWTIIGNKKQLSNKKYELEMKCFYREVFFYALSTTGKI